MIGDRDRGSRQPDREGDDDGKKRFSRRKGCRFCGDLELRIDYKEPVLLMNFVGDRGKIFPRRLSGVCAKHQRQVATAIKRARQLALLSYTQPFQAPQDEVPPPAGGPPS